MLSSRILTSSKSLLVYSSARILVLRAFPPLVHVMRMAGGSSIRCYESVTYSGGQATEGQGGYYGSGGARVNSDNGQCQHRPEMLALAGDVQYIQQVMQQVEILQNALEKQESEISPKSIELRQTIKKLVTGPQFMEALGRLEVKGSPVWGLSSEEREMIIHAREIVNEC